MTKSEQDKASKKANKKINIKEKVLTGEKALARLFKLFDEASEISKEFYKLTRPSNKEIKQLSDATELEISQIKTAIDRFNETQEFKEWQAAKAKKAADAKAN